MTTAYVVPTGAHYSYHAVARADKKRLQLIDCDKWGES